jgi:hypothetical protein
MPAMIVCQLIADGAHCFKSCRTRNDVLLKSFRVWILLQRVGGEMVFTQKILNFPLIYQGTREFTQVYTRRSCSHK